MSRSNIEWTEMSWNPVKGCLKVSAGCKNCYAIFMSWRHQHNPKTQDLYEGITAKTEGGHINFTGKVRLDEKALLEPLKRKKPTTYFVNSMSDLFYENIPFEVIDKVFAVMALCPQHTFQILTKRPERMKGYLERQEVSWLNYIAPTLEKNGMCDTSVHAYEMAERIASGASANNYILPNVWLGTSVENQKAANERIPHLLACPAAVRFLSCEPLLELTDINCIRTESYTYFPLKGEGVKIDEYQHGKRLKDVSTTYSTEKIAKIHWVIAGGESGPHARPTHPAWVRSLRDQCQAADVPFFFKQWGKHLPVCQNNEYENIYQSKEIDGYHYCEVGKHKAGRLLDGVLHDTMPTR